MKIVLAPDSYKGSMLALDVAKAMEKGVRRVVPDAETVLVPVADGGDGTLETLVGGTGGSVEKMEVVGPLGEPIVAEWGRWVIATRPWWKWLPHRDWRWCRRSVEIRG